MQNQSVVLFASLVFSSILFAPTAQAKVTDRFQCVLEVQDAKFVSSAKQQMVLAVDREPIAVGPLMNVQMTKGQSISDLTLQTQDAEFSAHFNLSYQHAIQYNWEGLPIKAKQQTCIRLAGSHCSKQGSQFSECAQSYSSCDETQNPFETYLTWKSTKLATPGLVPEFLVSALIPVRLEIEDVRGKVQGYAHLDCHHLNTSQSTQ